MVAEAAATSPQQPPEQVSQADLAVVAAQLGRPSRGVIAIAHRCPCGCPTVVSTRPNLPDGSPFPTFFYATCPALTGAISTLESEGMMREMTERLAADPDGQTAMAHRAAHEDYLERRAVWGNPEQIRGISAGGMPTRVKCLHVLVAHSLAVGPGINLLGDEALAALPRWWDGGCCAPAIAEVGP